MSKQTGYADVNGLRMYYEIHGSGGTPLLLLHGGLFNIDLQFGALLPGLAEKRQVIATDFQAHGYTNDIDRPLGTVGLASDVVGLLKELDVPQVDLFGFSVGGAVALYLAIKHPELVRKAVISSVPFSTEGERPENAAVGEMKVEMIAGTPMEAEYLAKSPHPDLEHLQTLLTKLGGYDRGTAGWTDDDIRGIAAPLLTKLGGYDRGTTGWTDDDIRGIAAPTLITVGDCDAVKLDHAVRFLQLRGGDVNGDFTGVPTSQLAVFPGTTHFNGLSRTNLVHDVVTTFLDAD